jgi:urease accessory protein
MIELTNKLKAGALSPSGTLTLSFEERQRSRYKAALDDGEEAWIILVRGGVLRGGDLLKATDGRIVQVRGKAEPLMEVRSSDAQALAKAAYHLGNRHAHVEVGAGYLRCERDHVYRDMLQGLGLSATDVDTAFEPEVGAYAAGHAPHADGAKHAGRIHERNTGELQYAADGAHAGHDHKHEHGQHNPKHGEPGHVHGPACNHGHAHSAAPAPSLITIPIKSAPAPHVHGPDCKHDH